MHRLRGLLLAAALPWAVPGGAQAVSPQTRAANAAILKSLPAEDGQDADFAARGFLGTHPAASIPRDDGKGVAWDFAALDRLKGPAPDSVNPSLWRQSRLMAKHGLFRVSDRVFQVRGFDISVMTVILGDRGYILVDPLLSVETARAALALVRQKLGDRPVTGLIYTHSHSDHFGGAAGVISPEEASARKVPIIAPGGFLKEAISENVIAGPAMSRRAIYAFGHLIGTGPKADISDGIGPAFNRLGNATGSVHMLPPTHEVTKTGEEVDG